MPPIGDDSRLSPIPTAYLVIFCVFPQALHLYHVKYGRWVESGRILTVGDIDEFILLTESEIAALKASGP
jgi:hypothetical protein